MNDYATNFMETYIIGNIKKCSEIKFSVFNRSSGIFHMYILSLLRDFCSLVCGVVRISRQVYTNSHLSIFDR